MQPGLRTSATGMRAQQTMVDTIANNLANVNTTGFKRSRADFADLLYENLQSAQVVGSDVQGVRGAQQVGRGVKLGALTRYHGQGPLQNTGKPFDIAVQGEGFFQVEKPDGTALYTRDGTFTVSDLGYIVTKDGYPLSPNVQIPQDARDVSISAGGVVSASVGASASPVELGRIELVRFTNTSGLTSEGGNYYSPSAAAGEPQRGTPGTDGNGSLSQGYLEASNVEIVEEMVSLITAQRAYEVNQKALQANDEMLQQTTQGLIR